MQPTTASVSISSNRPLDQATEHGASSAQNRPAQMVESNDLFKGNKTVGILHNGSLYRLQATKMGKLILTK